MFGKAKNQTLFLWRACSLVGLAIFAGYLLFFIFKVFDYVTFSRETVAKIESFYVAEVSKNKFAIGADYTYVVDGLVHKKSYVFNKPFFLNEFAAEKNLKYWDMEEMKVWYKAKAPIVSVLQKNFPFKTMIYAFVILMINIYFAYLRWYVTKNEYFTSREGTSEVKSIEET